MTGNEDIRELTIDWGNEAIWVQNRMMYLVLQDDGGPELDVQDQRGERQTVSRKTLEQTHFALRDATVYKSRYAPIQAICPGEACTVTNGETSIFVPEGDAVIKTADGTLTVLARHEFDCAYAIVSGAQATAP